MADFDVLVAGEINPDLLLTGDVTPVFGQVEKLVDQAKLTIGSSSAIFACGAARLGLRVKFVGICGDDDFGRFMLVALQRHGIDISSVMVDKQYETGISVILNRKSDRAILTHLGCMAALQAEQLPNELLISARHLHVCSYFLQKALQPGLPELFRRAQAAGLTTSLDTNWDPSQKWHGVREVLEYTTIFMPNHAEVCAIAGIPDPSAAAINLGHEAEIVVVKLGEQGAFGVQKEEIVKVPALSTAVVDTVGAGDSFDAGFIYGFLNRWEMERSLRLGVICGGLSTQAMGGTDGQPTLEQALDLLTI